MIIQNKRKIIQIRIHKSLRLVNIDKLLVNYSTAYYKKIATSKY